MENKKRSYSINVRINGNEMPVTNKPDSSERSRTQNPMNPLSKTEVAVGQENETNDEFQWILPEFEENNESLHHNKKQKKIKSIAKANRKKRVFPSVFLTITLAIVVGASLGVLLLKMVIADGPLKTQNTSFAPSSNGSSESDGKENVTLPPITAYVVQAGVFSNTESAKSEAMTLTSKGIPAKLMTFEGKTYLFVGISDNLESAKSLAAELKTKGIETYAKEISIEGKPSVSVGTKEKELLLESSAFFQTIISGLNHRFQANNDIQIIKSKLVKIDKVENERVKKIAKELNESVLNLEHFLKENKKEYAVKAQQNLLNFLALYHAM